MVGWHELGVPDRGVSDQPVWILLRDKPTYLGSHSGVKTLQYTLV